MGGNEPPGMTNLDPSGMAGKFIAGDHLMLLYTIYQSFGPHNFTEEEFCRFFSI